MGKLYQNRSLLGNIALVIFLAFLACLTFGTVAPAPVKATTTLTEDPNLQWQGTAATGPAAVIQDKSGNWKGNGDTATIRTNKAKTEVDFKIQVLTDGDFSSLWFKIIKGGNIVATVYASNIPSAIYNKVYGTVYFVYQFIYHWVYSSGLSTGAPDDYTLFVYSNANPVATIYLDLEEPPPEEGGGGAPPSPTTTTTTDTGTLVSTTDGQATLTADDKKVEALAANPQVTQVEFAIPADKAAKQGTVAVGADTLAKVFEAGKPAVMKVGDVQLFLPPGAIDLSVFKGQGVTLKFSIGKGEAAAPGDVAYKPAGEVFNISVRAEANGVDKGGISSLDKPVTLALPYDPAKLAGVPEDYLGIYRLTDGAWEYVGGKIDRTKRTVSVTRTSLSTYAVMAYDKNFADMAGHWAEKDVKLMAARHIAAGVTATSFAPDANVTRAQFAAFLLRALNVAERKATGTRFADVAAGAWYAGAVETAAAQGLVAGYPDGTFKPEALITREEVATMVTRALALNGKPAALTEGEAAALLARFQDAGEIGTWAKTSMAVAVREGIVNGRLVDRCVPKAHATRAEAAVMTKRFLTVTGGL